MWQIPSPRPVVLCIWLHDFNLNDKINRKKRAQAERANSTRRNGSRELLHNLAKDSNLKFLNDSSYLWTVVEGDMTAMKYWVSFVHVKRFVSADVVCVILATRCLFNAAALHNIYLNVTTSSLCIVPQLPGCVTVADITGLFCLSHLKGCRRSTRNWHRFFRVFSVFFFLQAS